MSKLARVLLLWVAIVHVYVTFFFPSFWCSLFHPTRFAHIHYHTFRCGQVDTDTHWSIQICKSKWQEKCFLRLTVNKQERCLVGRVGRWGTRGEHKELRAERRKSEEKIDEGEKEEVKLRWRGREGSGVEEGRGYEMMKSIGKQKSSEEVQSIHVYSCICMYV